MTSQSHRFSFFAAKAIAARCRGLPLLSHADLSITSSNLKWLKVDEGNWSTKAKWSERYDPAHFKETTYGKTVHEAELDCRMSDIIGKIGKLCMVINGRKGSHLRTPKISLKAMMYAGGTAANHEHLCLIPPNQALFKSWYYFNQEASQLLNRTD
ncbi:hypothetical protein HPP92_026724 [Vanilla planifolia]|uniref:Uncharacterized protein n=1 Tax=Vanilla planifolia TaxID=51239 RepID=A0A835PF72_VANPL|nr:hypothetical protein HPP92_026724 [Vanilla planifolia]